MDYSTYHLITRPSFLSGMASLFDFQGSLNQYNYNRSEEEADQAAILSDWIAIGKDLKKVMGEHG